ncbi:MAG: translation initiation factor IF-3 [Candidatus Gastranaerophilales bacterium]|nr:translation initiation factor IF-3 [Candidatus Gastranaerophilales bacterium]
MQSKNYSDTIISLDFKEDKTISKDNNQPLLNRNIKSKEVRLIDNDGNNHGVVPTQKALLMAEDKGLDLIVVSPNQEPPVAKILDYGKYKYEIEKRAKESKKKQHTVEIKEVKVRYKIDVHDYNVKINSIKKFIAGGNKVKLVVMLRGREMQHNHLAYDLANRFLTDLEGEKLTVEKKPSMDGRNVVTILAP